MVFGVGGSNIAVSKSGFEDLAQDISVPMCYIVQTTLGINVPALPKELGDFGQSPRFLV